MLDNISLSEIILFTIGTLFSVIGFFLKDLHGRLDKVETGLQNHRVEDAQNLASRNEIQILRDDIRGMLSPLHNKIDGLETFLRGKQ